MTESHLIDVIFVVFVLNKKLAIMIKNDKMKLIANLNIDKSMKNYNT